MNDDARRETVVQFGAGAIGRGFVGQSWTQAGYEVVFVDLDDTLIRALNERRAYPLRLLPPSGPSTDLRIAPVRALDGRDADAVADALARCAFACTAAGVNAFRGLAPTLAMGISRRAVTKAAHTPLNIICCENQVGAGALLRAAVSESLPADSPTQSYFANAVAFVDASVGRMVPPPTPELRLEDPLLVAAEPYAELPIDSAAWIGPVPAVPGLLPKTPFAAYVARKLFIHNGGHAALAYHGYRAGHTFIWEAADDKAVVGKLTGFWSEASAALIPAYGVQPDDLQNHQSDLLQRFRNCALADTVVRVARDPLRKLRHDDRLVGAALLCAQFAPSLLPVHICRAIAAALQFDAPGDPTAGQVQQTLRQEGVSGALQTLCGLSPTSPLIPLIESAMLDY